MRVRSASAVALILAIAGCGSSPAPSVSQAAAVTVISTPTATAPTQTASPTPTATASPTPSPKPTATAGPTPSSTPTPSPSGSPSNGANDPFAGRPYILHLPAGWVGFDPSSPEGRAAFDAAGQANPGLAPFIQLAGSLPNLTMAINKLLGNILVVIDTPSHGLPLATIGRAGTAQLQAIPGLVGKPTAKPIRLSLGNALHWSVRVAINQVGGGRIQVDESIYLVVSRQTAIDVEFVKLAGGIIPDESAIIKSLRFRP